MPRSHATRKGPESGLSLFPQNHTDDRTGALPKRGFVTDDVHHAAVAVEYPNGPVFDIVFIAEDFHALFRSRGDVGGERGFGKTVRFGVAGIDDVGSPGRRTTEG